MHKILTFDCYGTLLDTSSMDCLDNPYMKFGKHYVRLLMKDTIWNSYGILVVRIGLTSISTAKGENPFAAYTQKATVLVL